MRIITLVKLSHSAYYQAFDSSSVLYCGFIFIGFLVFQCVNALFIFNHSYMYGAGLNYKQWSSVAQASSSCTQNESID